MGSGEIGSGIGDPYQTLWVISSPRWPVGARDRSSLYVPTHVLEYSIANYSRCPADTLNSFYWFSFYMRWLFVVWGCTRGSRRRAHAIIWIQTLPLAALHPTWRDLRLLLSSPADIGEYTTFIRRVLAKVSSRFTVSCARACVREMTALYCGAIYSRYHACSSAVVILPKSTIWQRCIHRGLRTSSWLPLWE